MDEIEELIQKVNGGVGTMSEDDLTKLLSIVGERAMVNNVTVELNNYKSICHGSAIWRHRRAA